MPAVKLIKNLISFVVWFFVLTMQQFFNYNPVFNHQSTSLFPMSKEPNDIFVIFHAGKMKWIREESLADIAAIKMVDLPLSDSEGAIEKQLKSDNGT